MPILDVQGGLLAGLLDPETEPMEISAVLVRRTAICPSSSLVAQRAAMESSRSCRLSAMYQKDMAQHFGLAALCLALVVSEPGQLLALSSVVATKPNEL